jgi:hypothetical protein
MTSRCVSVGSVVKHKLSGDSGVVNRLSTSGFASVKYTSGEYSGKLVGVRVEFFEVVDNG